MTGKTQARLERRRMALDVLRQRYPALFTQYVPLALHIHDALSADLDGILSREQLRDALGQWCNSKGYRRCLKSGRARLGLAGEKAGDVSKDAARHARVSPYRSKTKPRDQAFQRSARFDRAPAVMRKAHSVKLVPDRFGQETVMFETTSPVLDEDGTGLSFSTSMLAAPLLTPDQVRTLLEDHLSSEAQSQ